MNACDASDLIDRIKALNSPMLPEPTGESARLSCFTGIKAVLFDIYGTLLTCRSGDVGTGSAGQTAFALESLRESGFSPSGPSAGARAVELLKFKIEADHARLNAEGIKHPEVDIREIWESVLRDLERERLVAMDGGRVPRRPVIERLAVEYECRVNPAWPMPGLNRMIGELRGRGLILGVVSNAQFYTPLLFEALPESDWSVFDRDLCVLSYELREAKPSARIFEVALNRLAERYDCAPSETVFLGNDMLNDIMPAARLGCKTALFAGDAGSLRLRQDDERCSGIEPDLVLTSLAQLPDAAPTRL